MRQWWIIFIAALGTASAFAQPLAEKVPADAIVYLGWRGSEKAPTQYDDSHLKAILDNSKIREAFSQLLPQVMDKIFAKQPAAKQRAQTCEALATQMFKHPTAIYFAGLNQANPQQPMPKL